MTKKDDHAEEVAGAEEIGYAVGSFENELNHLKAGATRERRRNLAYGYFKTWYRRSTNAYTKRRIKQYLRIHYGFLAVDMRDFDDDEES